MFTEIATVVVIIILILFLITFFRREESYKSDPSPRYMEVDGEKFGENQEPPKKQDTVYETARTFPREPNKLNFTF